MTKKVTNINPDYLKGLIKKFYDGGEYQKELDDCVLTICEGYLAAKRTRYLYGDTVADDILSDAHIKCSMAILEKKVDLGYNPFNYLTRIVATTLAGVCKEQNERCANMKKYAEDNSCYVGKEEEDETEDF